MGMLLQSPEENVGLTLHTKIVPCCIAVRSRLLTMTTLKWFKSCKQEICVGNIVFRDTAPSRGMIRKLSGSIIWTMSLQSELFRAASSSAC